jgi:hypothetical protein
MDRIHPLRLAYNKAIERMYKQTPWGDPNPIITEQAAMKIAKLGLDYGTYVDLAIRLCDGLAKHNGWKYPYYNVVVGDKVIAKVAKLTKYTELDDNDNDQSEMFEHELLYATAYIAWWFGEGEKPQRDGVDVPTSIKGKVAEYLCRMYGVPSTSSNYNVICKSLETRRQHEQ